MRAVYNTDTLAEKVGVIYARYSSDKQNEQSIEN